MTVKELYEALDKTKEYWRFDVYVDGIQDNLLASCNASYDVEGSQNKGEGFSDFLYSVKDLFDYKVISFYACVSGISVKINSFSGLQYKKLVFYTDENGEDRAKNEIFIMN